LHQLSVGKKGEGSAGKQARMFERGGTAGENLYLGQQTHVLIDVEGPKKKETSFSQGRALVTRQGTTRGGKPDNYAGGWPATLKGSSLKGHAIHPSSKEG